MREPFEVVLDSSKMITPNVKHLVFSRLDTKHLDFVAGQFITFLFDDEQTGKTIRRSYSLANPPAVNHELEIAVAPVDNGFATKVFFALENGAILTASGPFGRLVLKPEETIRHCLLVATGTGVSPYRAMLPDIAERLARDQHARFTLLLGVQYEQDLLYGEDFISFAEQQPRFEFRAYLSRETQLKMPYHYSGYVQKAFSELDLDPDNDIVYLCGNPNMIDDSFASLQDMGFHSRSVRREKYISAK